MKIEEIFKGGMGKDLTFTVQEKRLLRICEYYRSDGYYRSTVLPLQPATTASYC